MNSSDDGMCCCGFWVRISSSCLRSRLRAAPGHVIGKGSRVGVSAVCFVRVSLWAFPTPRLQLELRHAGGSAKKKGRAESLEEIPPEPSDGRNHSTKFLLYECFLRARAETLEEFPPVPSDGRNPSKKFLLYGNLVACGGGSNAGMFS